MKPTITKEQAEAIESCAMNCGDTYKERFIRGHADDSGDWSGEYASLNDLDLLTLAAALVNGYEVEKTPEEKVREYYEGIKRTRDEKYLAGGIEGKRFHDGALVGICIALDYFGIKIEGVNA
ncbi:hypothetical protein R7M47_05405 [Bacillus inaquosorum]|uniref:hypothetical protein n=1 Tax=Bacillus inaquosorum TaxID=483913 RepID=UPI003899E0AD